MNVNNRHNELKYLKSILKNSKLEYIIGLVTFPLVLYTSLSIIRLYIVSFWLYTVKIVLCSLYTPYFIISTYRIFQAKLSEIIPVRKILKTMQREKLLIVIPTKGTNITALYETYLAILEQYQLLTRYFSFKIHIVTEEDIPKSHKKFLNFLTKISRRELLEIIYVPRNYRAPKETKYKARALHYHLEKFVNNNDNMWLYYLDEESKITEYTVLGIVEFISKEDGPRIGQGLIIYSNYWGKSIISSIMDSPRPAFEFLIQKGQIDLLRKCYFGIKGSHLLVHSKIVKEIGWAHGVFADDLIFGIKAQERFGNIFKWMSGYIIEQPPFSLKDLFKQRERWYRNLLDVIIRGDISNKSRLILLYNVILWHTALPVLLATFVRTPCIPILNVLNVIYSFYLFNWLYLHYYGGKLNIYGIERLSKREIIKYEILHIILSPICLLVFSIMPYYYDIKFLIRLCKSLIDKNRNEEGFTVIHKDYRKLLCFAVILTNIWSLFKDLHMKS